MIDDITAEDLAEVLAIGGSVHPFVVRLARAHEAARARLEQEERWGTEAMADRDAGEESITEIAESLGCEREWSNLHSHWQCVPETIANLLAHVARDERTVADLRIKLAAADSTLETSTDMRLDLATRLRAAEADNARLREAISTYVRVYRVGQSPFPYSCVPAAVKERSDATAGLLAALSPAAEHRK